MWSDPKERVQRRGCRSLNDSDCDKWNGRISFFLILPSYETLSEIIRWGFADKNRLYKASTSAALVFVAHMM